MKLDLPGLLRRLPQRLESADVKRLLWGLAFVLGSLSVFGALKATSGLYAYLERTRVVETALELSRRRAADLRLSWLPDGATPRPLEPQTRERVQTDYLRALDELSYSLYTGDGGGLVSYFQAGALHDAQLAAGSSLRGQFRSWDHRLRLNFYAPDGATVAFTDTYLYAQGSVLDADLTDLRVAERSLDVVMTLDDGAWRVRHWRVNGDTPLRFARPAFPKLAGAVRRMRGINYTPRSAPFDAFWPNFNPAEVDADLYRAAQLGFNTLRFFIPYPAPPGLAEHLPEFVRLAERHDLQLMPTLLDGYTRYRLEDMPEVLSYVDNLSELLANENVVLIDVKNEADRDFEASGQRRTATFLSVIADYTRQATGKPVTAGLISPEAELTGALDVVSLHHYGEAEALSLRLTAAERFGKPVLLQEFGFHTLALKLPDPHSELEQAHYYQDVLASATLAGSGWLAWTLYDLPTGLVPDGRRAERHLGVLRADGRPKPVTEVLLGSPAPPLSPLDQFWKLRYLLSLSLLGAGLLLAAAYWLRRGLSANRFTEPLEPTLESS